MSASMKKQRAAALQNNDDYPLFLVFDSLEYKRKRHKARQESSPERENISAAQVPPEADLPKTYTNSLGIEFILIPSGTFIMGAGKRENVTVIDNVRPRHRVTISRAFYIGRYVVTQEQWIKVMGHNPSKYSGSNRAHYPVEQVSWHDVQSFIKKLNQDECKTGYRLPTEAEWEYASRAGTRSAYCFGNDSEKLRDYAWYKNHKGLWTSIFGSPATHPVGQLKPNGWGLFDMHGNVWELTQDWYYENYYSSRPATDPMGPAFGLSRVIRGGCCCSDAKSCRSVSRSSNEPYVRSDTVGFRLVLSPE